MEVDSPNKKPLTPQEQAHLEKLKSVVEKALENGSFLEAETAQIESIIWADGKATYEELRTVNQTV